VCLAFYTTSTGTTRTSAVVSDTLMPNPGERAVHGNASFTGDYILRAARNAAARGSGVIALHSHPLGSGWKGLSSTDHDTERSYAHLIHEVTRLPLVGMTVAATAAGRADGGTHPEHPGTVSYLLNLHAASEVGLDARAGPRCPCRDRAERRHTAGRGHDRQDRRRARRRDRDRGVQGAGRAVARAATAPVGGVLTVRLRTGHRGDRPRRRCRCLRSPRPAWCRVALPTGGATGAGPRCGFRRSARPAARRGRRWRLRRGRGSGEAAPAAQHRSGSAAVHAIRRM
jgi:hypothetical protein